MPRQSFGTIHKAAPVGNFPVKIEPIDNEFAESRQQNGILPSPARVWLEMINRPSRNVVIPRENDGPIAQPKPVKCFMYESPADSIERDNEMALPQNYLGHPQQRRKNVEQEMAIVEDPALAHSQDMIVGPNVPCRYDPPTVPTLIQVIKEISLHQAAIPSDEGPLQPNKEK
jgi:hypothetical protein